MACCDLASKMYKEAEKMEDVDISHLQSMLRLQRLLRVDRAFQTVTFLTHTALLSFMYLFQSLLRSLSYVQQYPDILRSILVVC